MQPLISVIIPIYNVEQYLKRCLDSVLCQSYTNLEIILVDDGSPDNCPTICDEYATKDSRIIVIHKKNGGLSDARNTGLDTCKGEFITFIDSDDWIHPDYVSTLLGIAIECHADISIGEIKKTSIFNSFYEKQQVRKQVYTPQKAIVRLFSKTEASFIAACGKLFKRELISSFRFPKNKIHEDEYLNYQWLYSAYNIVYTNKILYFYYQRPDSIMGKNQDYPDDEIFTQQKVFFQEKREPKILRILETRRIWSLLHFYWQAHRENNLVKLESRKKALNSLSIPLPPSFRHLVAFPFLAIWKNYPTFYIYFKRLTHSR